MNICIYICITYITYTHINIYMYVYIYLYITCVRGGGSRKQPFLCFIVFCMRFPPGLARIVDKGTWLRNSTPPRKDHHRALGMVLL